ncbi:ABC-type multidrug transport system fused ATPase/permease subunit [Lipingzhangella halophila]|uniref:ABC-type multidrug transport system fused ATPase/permease subunit n=1 Tax=Lipingzhangella halophila TaxID=1783352 RepID=A0A7W7RFI6_9ACTN|nr:ABC transporter ATP-binding protein [Lipingzhangella halophila]MBB4931014.1 ABC-type multidrug transport system fused ATPase/permease subunit [Lipingzhangella halophila]
MSQGSTQDGPASGSPIFRRGMRVLWTAIRTEPWVCAVAVLGASLHAAFTVASARVLGHLTDTVILPAFEEGRTTAAALATAAAMLLGVGLAKALGLGARRLFAGLMQFRMQARYRRRVARKYLGLPLSWHHRHPTGQLLSNANSDVEATWQPLAPLPMTIGSVLMLLIAAVAMVVTDPVLALVGFVVFPLLFVVNVVFQRKIGPVATRAQRLRAEVSEVAHESFDGALVVKTLGREDTETARFTDAAHRLRDAQIRVGRMRGMFDPVMEGLPNLGVLAVLLVGAWRLSNGAIVPGDLVQIAYLFTLLALPIRSFGWLLGDLPRSVVGWNRIHAVLAADGAMHYGGQRIDGNDRGVRVTARGVNFSYEDSYDAAGDGASGRDLVAEPVTDTGTTPEEGATRATVLTDVHLDIAPGRTVAVVGPTGSGKSTLTTLLMRLVDPDTGTISHDGVDVRELERGQIANAAALVPQSTFVFEDTVRDNVTLGNGASDDDVWAALRLARADSFVAALPEGLDTRLGERGTSLSGGQRQRLALARAVVRRPRLLILDDATSAVDPQVEAQILAGLRDTDLGATVVVIAYRRATIELADEVIYLEQRTVRDRGTHEELLRRSPGYEQLVTAYERAAEERAADAASKAFRAVGADDGAARAAHEEAGVATDGERAPGAAADMRSTWSVDGARARTERPDRSARPDMNGEGTTADTGESL